MPQVFSTDTRENAPQTADTGHQHLVSMGHLRTGVAHSPQLIEEAQANNSPCKYLQRLQAGLKRLLYIKMGAEIQLSFVTISNFLTLPRH